MEVETGVIIMIILLDIIIHIKQLHVQMVLHMIQKIRNLIKMDVLK